MKRNAFTIATTLMSVGLAGCATLVEGTSQPMAINTTPPGASCAVEQGAQHAGTVAPTPGSLTLSKSREDLAVTCTKAGFQTATVQYKSEFVGTTFANFLVGGAVGFIVDAASGANFKYPKQIDLGLVPLPPAPSVAPYASTPALPAS